MGGNTARRLFERRRLMGNGLKKGLRPGALALLALLLSFGGLTAVRAEAAKYHLEDTRQEYDNPGSIITVIPARPMSVSTTIISKRRAESRG